MTQSDHSLLAHANRIFRNGEYAQAIQYYVTAAQSLHVQAELFPHFEANLTLARKRYLRQRSEARGRGEPLRVAVCGWELSHNPAGRVLTLADAYRRVTPEVEIIGAIFPRWGRSLWSPMQGYDIPCHSILVENEADFVLQALRLVAAHPYDMVHLSKPRFPNLVFGLLYALVWGARVIWDIDDEELGFVSASEPMTLEQALGAEGRLPPLKKLHASFWTRLAVGQVSRFDGVTVSNPALQQRYGGTLIPHVRDETRFIPSQKKRTQARRLWRIPENSKVVLFFGTPRRHKGLLDTAQAIAALGRDDVWFVIVGDFPNARLKTELQQVEGLRCHFIPGQPYSKIPEVVALGDYTVLLQESSSLVAQYQLPAKLVDALAMGLIVFAQVTPATAWLAEKKCIISVTPETLHTALKEQFIKSSRSTGNDANRKVFLDELTLSSAEPRLQEVIKSPKRKQPTWHGNLALLLANRIESLLL